MVGVSYFFILVDALGGVFSLLSLIFKEEFDVIAGVTYSVVIVGIFLLSESFDANNCIGHGLGNLNYGDDSQSHCTTEEKAVGPY